METEDTGVEIPRTVVKVDVHLAWLLKKEVLEGLEDGKGGCVTDSALAVLEEGR
jgi:hypothetical protein